MYKNIKINNFPYGKVYKRLISAATWLNQNKKKIINGADEEKYPYGDFFDFPDYWNMPKKISNNLSSDEVDWIQEETYEWHNRLNC